MGSSRAALPWLLLLACRADSPRPPAPATAPSGPSGLVMWTHRPGPGVQQVVWRDLDAATTGTIARELERSRPLATLVTGAAWFGRSDTGRTLVLRRPDRGPGVVATDLRGPRVEAISPDGSRAVVDCEVGDGRCLGRITVAGVLDQVPLDAQQLPDDQLWLAGWLPDGRLVYEHPRQRFLLLEPATGAVTPGPLVPYPDAISLDGALVAWSEEGTVSWRPLSSDGPVRSAPIVGDVDRCAFMRDRAHTLTCTVQPGPDGGRRRLIAIRTETSEVRELAPWVDPLFMVASPDGRYVAVAVRLGEGRQQIVAFDLASGERHELGEPGPQDWPLAWIATRAEATGAPLAAHDVTFPATFAPARADASLLEQALARPDAAIELLVAWADAGGGLGADPCTRDLEAPAHLAAEALAIAPSDLGDARVRAVLYLAKRQLADGASLREVATGARLQASVATWMTERDLRPAPGLRIYLPDGGELDRAIAGELVCQRQRFDEVERYASRYHMGPYRSEAEALADVAAARELLDAVEAARKAHRGDPAALLAALAPVAARSEPLAKARRLEAAILAERLVEEIRATAETLRRP